MIETSLEQAACLGYVSNGSIVVAFLPEQPERLFQNIVHTNFLFRHCKDGFNYLQKYALFRIYQTVVWFELGELEDWVIKEMPEA